MKITSKRLLNILFSLFIASTILMSASYIGKSLQLVFIIISFLFSIKKFQFSKYNLLEWIFVLYVFAQTFLGIAVLPDHTLDMAITLTYVALFSLAFYNYVFYIGDLHEVSKVYANATIISFIIAILLYHDSLASFRLSASSNISLGGFVILGGSSSTALAMQAALPAFFISLFPPDGNKKKANIYILIFLAFAILTGTRKVLILFLYILFFVNEMLKKETRNFKLLKSFLAIIVAVAVSYFALMNIPILYNTIGHRLENAILYFQLGQSDEASIRGRERMLREALVLFNEKKILGWGMDYYKYGKNLSLGYYCHNNFLEILSGGGILAFILYYARYLYLLLRLKKRFLKNKLDKAHGIVLMGMLILMTILEYWQVTYFYRYILIAQVFMLAIVNYKGEIEYSKGERV